MKLVKIFFARLSYTMQRKKKFFFLPKKGFLRKAGCGGLNKKRKEGFLFAFALAIKNDPTIRKHTKELKVHEKTLHNI